MFVVVCALCIAVVVVLCVSWCWGVGCLGVFVLMCFCLSCSGRLLMFGFIVVFCFAADSGFVCCLLVFCLFY